MIDQINELPEDGLKSSPETSRYTENKWISRKNQNKLYFLHLIDILSDLLLISSPVLWRRLNWLNGWGKGNFFDVDLFKVKNCWVVEEGSVSGDCKDDFVI